MGVGHAIAQSSGRESGFLAKKIGESASATMPETQGSGRCSAARWRRVDATVCSLLIAIPCTLGCSPARPRELYGRIARTVLINNVDDHWRNHGLLRGRTGWRLAPVFDLSPSRSGSARIRARSR